MPLIHLTTFIAAPAERVFDLSRSVRVHKESMKKYGEESVGGKSHGLLDLNDTVTWKAKHLFRLRQLKSKITALDFPHSFTDEMEQGPFKKMKHEHFFKQIENGTIMIDQFHFEVRQGLFGKLLNALFLQKYLKRVLEERNAVIRQVAESNTWKQFLT